MMGQRLNKGLMDMRNLIVAFLCLFIVCTAGPFAHAQDENDFIIDNIISQKTDDYQPMTYENLAKMYWAVRKFELDNDEALDILIRITECELYQNYYTNEFEWQKIRAAMRDYIKKNIAVSPMRMEAIIPIRLSRYDVDQQVFLVDQKDALLQATRVSIGHTYPGVVCGKYGAFEGEGYITGIVLMLSRPFTFEKIPVERELAKLYLDEVAQKYAKTPQDYERIVYLRIKVQLKRYRREVSVVAGQRASEIFATLEGYEVYADKNKEKLMYERDLRPKIRRYVRKHKEDVDEQQEPKETSGIE